jgi:hypothetical protein
MYGRLAFTVGAVLAALAAARVTLPGVDVSTFRMLDTYDPTVFGILALSLAPVLNTSTWIEVLALIIPRWRSWRTGGYAERGRLWSRLLILAAALTVTQAFFIVRWLERMPVLPVGGDVFSPGWGPALAVMVTLVAGVAALTVLAVLIGKYGGGNGFAILLAGFSVVPVGEALLLSVRQRVEVGDRVLLPLMLAAVVIGAVTRAAGGRELRPNAAPLGHKKLPVPAGGMQAIVVAQSLLRMPGQLAQFGIDLGPVSRLSVPGTRAYRATELLLVAGTCALLTWLFNRPRNVAQAWSAEAPVQDDGASPPMDDQVRGAFARALAWSLALAGAMVAVEWMCADAKLVVDVLFIAGVACVTMDVAGELAFRRRHGSLVGVWPVHRLYTLDGMLAALEAAGIPAYPRARRVRTLWNYFLPLVPVEILVPAQDLERARAALGLEERAVVVQPDAAALEPGPRLQSALRFVHRSLLPR